MLRSRKNTRGDEIRGDESRREKKRGYEKGWKETRWDDRYSEFCLVKMKWDKLKLIELNFFSGKEFNFIIVIYYT